MRERRALDEPESVRRRRAGAAPLPIQSEREFQQQIITLARLRGWLCYHPHDSRHSAAGWPDLACCRPPRLLLIEVKSATGTVSAHQRLWLDALGRCPGVETYVWRPCDWPEIQEVLA